ncbi:MAG: HAD-IB family phosphatase [Gemmatimonadaceae bacterium]
MTAGRRRRPAFASVVLDVDSTVAGVEGIDWLAARRGPEVAREVASLTDRAMRGAVPLEAVFGLRLERVRPTRDDLAALGREYVARAAPGAADAVATLRAAGVRVVLVSGGLRPALLPLAESLGIDAADVHGVEVALGGDGDCAGHDSASPLATAAGKRVVVERLALPRPTLAVGDGATDLAMRPAVDAFAAFTGFVRRAEVAAAADAELPSFAALLSYVLP